MRVCGVCNIYVVYMYVILRCVRLRCVHVQDVTYFFYLVHIMLTAKRYNRGDLLNTEIQTYVLLPQLKFVLNDIVLCVRN